MKSLLISICLFCCGMPLTTQGQTEPTKKEAKASHEIGLSAGYNFGIFKDQNYSPLLYSSNGLLYGLNYQKTNKRTGNIFLADLNYNADTVQTSTSKELGANTIQANLGLGYLKNINIANSDKWNVAIGGKYNFFIQYLDYREQAAYSFLGNHSIDVMGLAEYQISPKHSISGQLSLPVMSLVVRPPYNGGDEELTYNNDHHPLKVITDGEFGTVNKIFAYDLKLRYDYQFSDRFTWNITYLNRYQNVNSVNKLVQMQHQFSTGLTLKF